MAVDIRIRVKNGYKAYESFNGKGTVLPEIKSTNAQMLCGDKKEIIHVSLHVVSQGKLKFFIISFGEVDSFIFNVKFYKECKSDTYRGILGEFTLSNGYIIHRYELERVVDEFRTYMTNNNDVLRIFYA
jgi:hypothetical protein